MSIPVVREIIERARDDVAFRQQLLNEPSVALAGYSLTEQEQQRFMALTAEVLGRLHSGELSIEGWITGGD